MVSVCADSGLRAILRAVTYPLRASDPEQPADAIVILGAALNSDGTLTRALLERVEAGLELWQRGFAPIITVTGNGIRDIAEADAMAAWLVESGLPPGSLIVEGASMNTWENAARCADLLLPTRRRVWLVTQPYHLRRARHMFRSHGFEALAWHDRKSVHYRGGRSSWRCVARECGSWGVHAGRRLSDARDVLKAML